MKATLLVQETTESTADTEIATAIDTDSNDSTQTVETTTLETDDHHRQSATNGSTDITTDARETTDSTAATIDSTEIAEAEGFFDVDTIFTSGTFEIAGGGGRYLPTPSSKAKLNSLR